MFITFEGVECSGKSLQSGRLLEYLQSKNIPALLVREPGGTPVGEELRSIVLSNDCSPLTELFIMSASRSQLTNNIILPALAEGKVVISDRYFHSSVVYQGYGRDIDPQIVKDISEIAVMGLQPDITFVLSPKYETVINRLSQKNQKDRIELESQDFHKKIYTGFLDIAEQYDYISILDGDLPPDEIHSIIINALNI